MTASATGHRHEEQRGRDARAHRTTLIAHCRSGRQAQVLLTDESGTLTLAGAFPGRGKHGGRGGTEELLLERPAG